MQPKRDLGRHDSKIPDILTWVRAYCSLRQPSRTMSMLSESFAPRVGQQGASVRGPLNDTVSVSVVRPSA